MLAAQDLAFLANGAAFTAQGIQAFAKGGTFSNSIVNSPTLFRFANGTGLMGEAGPEAIMPLTRDGQGRLGVRYEGRQQPSQNQKVSVPQPAPQTNVRIVNAFDTSVVGDYIGSTAGEQVFMNFVRKNQSAIRGMIG
jgi:lambda family phage tail tape measure protein